MIIGFGNHLGAAERVFDALIQEPGKDQAEHFIAEKVQEAHRFVFHRVNQPRAVDQFPRVLRDRAVELRQIRGGTVRSPSRMNKKSPEAASKPFRTASPLPRPSPWRMSLI